MPHHLGPRLFPLLMWSTVSGLGGCLDWSQARVVHTLDGGADGDAGLAVDSDAAGPDAALPNQDGSASSLDAEQPPEAALGEEAGPGEPDATITVGDDAAVGTFGPAPVLHLSMNESQWGGLTGEVHDDSGSANNGTARGSATTSSVARFGLAGLFNGAGWVEVPDSPTLHPVSALSVAAWFYISAPLSGASPGIVAKRLAFASDTTFSLFLSPDYKITLDVAGEDNRFSSAAVVEMQRWVHVAFVFDGTLAPSARVTLYIDGKLDTTAWESSAEVPAYTASVLVGNLPGGGSTFVGSIDDVAIWTRALSASEVQALSAASSDNVTD